MNRFKAGDIIRLNENFGRYIKDTFYQVVIGEPVPGCWMVHGKVEIEHLNKHFSYLFDLVEEKTPEKEIESIVKVLPSWMKEAYYGHYVEIVTDFIKEYAKNHDISVTEGNETVLTAIPHKQGN